MDTFNKTAKQTSDLWQSLAPSQRLSLLVVPVLLVAGFAYLLWGGPSDASMTPLAFGKVMTDSELDEAEAVLVQKELKEFERSGNHLLVPSDKIEEYHGALLAGGGLPSGWAEEFEKKFDQSSVFTSGDQRKTMREIALAKELRRWLRAIPEVVDGNVVWARSQRRIGFDRKDASSGVTATVTLKPRSGREISNELAESIRTMIAGAVPDLTPADVVVFSTTGRAFEPENEHDALNGKLLRRSQDFSEMYRRKVESALSYIPNVLVTVHVDIDNVAAKRTLETVYDSKASAEIVVKEGSRNRNSATRKPSAEPGAVSNQPRELDLDEGPTETRSDTTTDSETRRLPGSTTTETAFVAAMPTSVQVSVGIPEDYYETAVVNGGTPRGEDDATKQAFRQAVADFKASVGADVTSTVARAIGTPDEKISVTSFVRVDPDVPELTESTLSLVGRWFERWGGTVGLGLFALIALWMLVRSGPSTSLDQADAEPQPAEAPAPTPEPSEAAREKAEAEAARDELQNSVRDNPEVAAAVIGKWIRAAQ